MFRRTLFIAGGLLAMLSTQQTASAQTGGPSPFGFGFQPFGFYQPYGTTYGNSLRTPPYFSLNPPVYYGARHARPYGVSPFASPPMVSPAANYQSRLRSQFLEPQVPTPGPAPRSMYLPEPMCNPYLHLGADTAPSTGSKVGAIKTNPFVIDSARIAAK